MEREVRSKNKEIRELREKLAFFQNQTSARMKPSISPTREYTDLEHNNREICTGMDMINKLKNELSAKDANINKMVNEIKALRADLSECQCKRNPIFTQPNQREEMIRSEFRRFDHAEKTKNIKIVNELQKELTQKDLKINQMSWEIESLHAELQKFNSQNTIAEGGNSNQMEMEELIREKNLAANLVNQMQKDLNQKEAIISKMTRDIDIFRRDLKECERSRAQLEEKIGIESTKRQDEKQALQDKELVVTRSVSDL